MKAVIAKYAGKPFRYGADCCQFVGECLEALGKSNPMRQFDYNDERSAYDVIGRYGSLSDAITATLGQPKAGEPEDGDVVVIEAGSEVAGIVWRGRIVARTKTGLMDFPRSRALYTWTA